MKSRLKFITVTFVITGLFPIVAKAAPPASPVAEITEIRLSSGGLAEIKRKVEIDGATNLLLTVPLSHVDDILKSLTVNDPKKMVGLVTMIGRQPLQEAFRTLPFSPEQLSSRLQLLQSLKGADVTISGEGKSTKGRIVNVETVYASRSKEMQEQRQRLDILSDGKLVSFDLDTVDVGFDDPALRNKIEAGLNAIMASRTNDARNIQIGINGEGRRNVEIGYVVPAPIWKATYRVTLDRKETTALLQGWAVVENATSDDWKNIRLSLATGSPVTLYQRLYESYFSSRKEIPIYTATGVVPRPDIGEVESAQADIMPNKAARSNQAAQYNYQNQAAMSPAPAAPMGFRFQGASNSTAGNDQLPPTEASESDVSTVFTVSDPVSLPRGQSMTFKFFEGSISANRISVFQPGLGIQNPVAAVVIRNQGSSSLPPGILTLFEQGSGYVGDAQLNGIPAGDTRTLFFAVDKKIQVSTNQSEEQKTTQLVYAEGLLKASVIRQTAITYKIKGASDADRTVVIEYPKKKGFTYSGEAIDSETANYIRIKKEIPQGKIVETKLIEEIPDSISYSLEDIEQEGNELLMLSMVQNIEPRLQAKIKEAAEALKKVNKIRATIADYDNEVSRITEDQLRIRQNLGAVPAKGELANGYLATMAEQEKRLSVIATSRIKETENLRLAREAFIAKLKTF